VARIYRAFLRQRTWTQAALAREIEIGVPALRKRLDELTTLGMPLEREDELPQIYWSVPGNWFPDGVLFSKDETADLLRVLWHTPRGRRRAKLLRAVLDASHDRANIAATEAAIVTRKESEAEEAFLPIAEEALAQRKALRLRFYSTERGTVETRSVSVHRVDIGPPVRLVATCHRTGQLKWFRVDNIVEANVDSQTPFRPASDDLIRRFCAESVDGFHGSEEAEEHVFFVRHPEATWVAKNLLSPMSAEPVDSGIIVTVATAGMIRVARYVVGLGGAARAETARLRALVEELARGALRAAAKPRKLAKAPAPSAERARRRADR
jgi:predicted DNA-binding transcriptional regulator YafY